MVIVEQDILGSLVLSFKYYPDYIDRVKALKAQFNPAEKNWILGVDKLEELKASFDGELYFKTPEWEITGGKPPDYTSMYTFNNKCDVDKLGFKLKPFNYQRFGIEFLVDRLISDKMAFIADDVGLGKTIQAIGAMKYMYDNNKIKDVAIICKKSIKHQWKEEIEKFVDIDADIYIVGDNKKKRLKTYEEIKNSKRKTILIANYHILLNDADFIKPDMTIYDEVHVAKKRNGEINKGCKKITTKADYCLFMTGTPIMSSPDDMYGIISIKDKKYFGTYKAFKERYITEYYNGRYKDVVGYRNLNELRDKIQHLILRRTDKEVAIDLPDIFPVDKYCDLDSIQEQGLVTAELKTKSVELKLDELRKALKKDQSNQQLRDEVLKVEASLKGFIAVEQAIANSPVLFHYSKSKAVRAMYKDVTPKQDYVSSKMEQILSILQDIKDGGKKAVMFSKYETVVDYVHDFLKKNGIETVTYNAKLNDDVRNTAISDFKTNPNITAIVGTDALAEGVNLQCSNNIIHIDLPFNIAIYNQRNGRARRAGSKHDTVFVYNLITKGSIDEKIFKKIKETKDTFDSFVSVDKAQSQLLKQLNK